MGYIYLLIAIVCEVIATTALKSTNGFSKIIPSIIVVIGYSLSFYFLSLVLKFIPLGITYAIWSGIGIALISITGYYMYNQKLDYPVIIGIIFIIIGVVIIQLNSTNNII